MTAPRMVTATVDVSSALTLLFDLVAHTQDIRPVLAGPVNKSVDSLFIRQFASEGAYGGRKWARLAPVTLALRNRPGHGRGGILRDTNRLWASLTKLGQGPDALFSVDENQLVRGTTLPYAQWHQNGWVSPTFVVVAKDGSAIPLYRKRPKRIPQREIIPEQIPTELIATWERLITNFVTTGKIN